MEQDFLLWSPRLVVGGVIAFHDTTKFDLNRVVKRYLCGAPGFRQFGYVDRIIFARKTEKTSLFDRLDARTLFLRRRLRRQLRGRIETGSLRR